MARILSLQGPSMSELGRARERVEKEADPDWDTYERLHEKFGGERP